MLVEHVSPSGPLDAASLLRVDTFSQIATHPFFRVQMWEGLNALCAKNFALESNQVHQDTVPSGRTRCTSQTPCVFISHAWGNPPSRGHNFAHSPLMVNRARVSWSVSLSVCALVSRPGEGRKAWHDRRQGVAETLALAQRRSSTSSSLSAEGPFLHAVVSLSSDALLVVKGRRGRLNPAYFTRGSTSAGFPPRGVSGGRADLLTSILT